MGASQSNHSAPLGSCWDSGTFMASPLGRRSGQDPPEKREWNFVWIGATSKTSHERWILEFQASPTGKATLERHKHWKKPLYLFHQLEKIFISIREKQGGEFPWRLSPPSKNHWTARIVRISHGSGKNNHRLAPDSFPKSLYIWNYCIGPVHPVLVKLWFCFLRFPKMGTPL